MDLYVSPCSNLYDQYGTPYFKAAVKIWTQKKVIQSSLTNSIQHFI